MISTAFEFSRQKVAKKLLENGTFQSKIYFKSEMMDFLHFQTCKTSFLAKFDRLKRQFLVKMASHFGGKIQIQLISVQKS